MRERERERERKLETLSVCVWERKEREIEWETVCVCVSVRETQRVRKRVFVCVCACVFVCVWETERQREKERGWDFFFSSHFFYKWCFGLTKIWVWSGCLSAYNVPCLSRSQFIASKGLVFTHLLVSNLGTPGGKPIWDCWIHIFNNLKKYPSFMVWNIFNNLVFKTHRLHHQHHQDVFTV